MKLNDDEHDDDEKLINSLAAYLEKGLLHGSCYALDIFRPVLPPPISVGTPVVFGRHIQKLSVVVPPFGRCTGVDVFVKVSNES